MYLSIPDQHIWDEWWCDGYEPSCSGLSGGCEYCLKKMYVKRHTYLTNYLNTFIKNKQDIINNVVKMPKLKWYAAPTAKIVGIEEFHSKKCNSVKHYWICKQLFTPDIFTYVKQFIKFNTVTICSCDTAVLLRCLYGNIYDGQEEESLDIIWGRYKNMNKKHIKNIFS